MKRPAYLLQVRIFFLSLLLVSASRAFSQVDSLENGSEPDVILIPGMEENLEMQSESTGAEEEDYNELFENLSMYRRHPLNLNSAKLEQLENLGLLNAIQISGLLEHIAKNGKLLCVYELQTINNFDLATIRMILPYIRVAVPEPALSFPLRVVMKEGKQTFTLRYAQVLETQKGYTAQDSFSPTGKQSSHYLGGPQLFLASYRFTYKNGLSIGISGRKDPGEQFFKGAQKNGFDFYSPHLFIRRLGRVNALAVGDYSIGFGQGLVGSSGLALSKTVDACLIQRTGSGLRPYTSSSKNRNLRGAAVSVQLGMLEYTFFLSRKKRDATVSDTSIGGKVLTVRTLATGMTHATTAEIASKNTIIEETEGVHIALTRHRFTTGITALHSLLSASLEPKPVPYNLFEFRGRELRNAGIEYTATFRNVNFFGEGALSLDAGKSLAKALIQGILVAADPRLSFVALYRNYQPDYHSFYSNAFSEAGKTENEQGLYIGTVCKLVPGLTLSAFYDYIFFPWLKYRVDAPSSGNDYFIKLIWNPDKKTECYLQFRRRERAIDPGQSTGPDEINYPVSGLQTNYRINVSLNVLSSIRLTSRLEVIQKTDSVRMEEEGFLLSQSLSLQKSRLPFTLAATYTLFDTPSGNTRIYAFEKGIPGTYATPSFSGRGSRWSGLIQLNRFHRFRLSLSFSRIFYDNLPVISPGTLNQINGRHKSEVNAECKVFF
jgi:hypothetical protein